MENSAVSELQISKCIERRNRFRGEMPSVTRTTITRTTAAGMVLLALDNDKSSTIQEILEHLTEAYGWVHTKKERETIVIWVQAVVAYELESHAEAEEAEAEEAEDESGVCLEAGAKAYACNMAMINADDRVPSDEENEFASKQVVTQCLKDREDRKQEAYNNARDSAVHRALGVLGL